MNTSRLDAQQHVQRGKGFSAVGKSSMMICFEQTQTVLSSPKNPCVIYMYID
jgi:hypothetical protein